MRKSLISLSLLCLTLTQLHAQTIRGVLKTVRPDFVQMQFAGNMGMISVGAGYQFFERKLNVSVLDGYTKRRFGKGSINTYNLRAAYNIAHFKLPMQSTLLPYAGVTCMVEQSGRGLFKGGSYPEGYYGTTLIHALIFVGGKVSIPTSNHGHHLIIYGETGTMDTYLYFVSENHFRHFTEIFSAAIGIQYFFSSKR